MLRPHGSATSRRLLARRSERGASAVEYALIAVLIAVVIIASVSVLGTRTSGLFQRTCDSMPPAGSSC
jgi:pilus assembly protein Flp/PilA